MYKRQEIFRAKEYSFPLPVGKATLLNNHVLRISTSKGDAVKAKMCIRDRIITHASKHLFNEELDRVAWDKVCDGLTFSEKEICKLILQGHTFKGICAELNKSESNITRCV